MRFMRLQRVLVLGQLVPVTRSNIDKQPLPKCIFGIKGKIAKYQEQYCKCLRHHTLLPDKWIWSHGSLHILRRLGSATVENARDKIRMTRTLVISSLLHCSFSRLLPAAQREGVEEAAIVRTDPVARSGPKICCQELLGESWNGMGYHSRKGTGGPCPIQHRCHTSSCTDTSAHTLATISTTTITGESFDNNAVIHVTQLPSTVLQHLKQLTMCLLRQHLLQLPRSMLGTEELLKTTLEAH